MLPITPSGATLSSENAKLLDDEFFGSDPLAYFSSRIGALLESLANPGKPSADVAKDFFEVLSLSDHAAVFTYDERARSLQVAVDALSLRHHAAEGLIRLLHGLTVMKPKEGDAASVWVAVADTPNNLYNTVTEVAAALNATEGLLQSLYFRPDINLDESVRGPFETAVAWINRASRLLTSNELPVNMANNKVKHGLAVRSRDDLRIELLTTPPDGNGNIPESAFGEGKSIPIFDRPLLNVLGHPQGKNRGLELTTLRIDAPSVLAEAWMFAVVNAALFHVAALNHFGCDDAIAPYPKLPDGPLPDQILTGRVDGHRAVVTTPADANKEARPTGLFIHNLFVPIRIDFESGFSGVVVEGQE